MIGKPEEFILSCFPLVLSHALGFNEVKKYIFILVINFTCYVVNRNDNEMQSTTFHKWVVTEIVEFLCQNTKNLLYYHSHYFWVLHLSTVSSSFGDNAKIKICILLNGDPHIFWLLLSKREKDVLYYVSNSIQKMSVRIVLTGSCFGISVVKRSVPLPPACNMLTAIFSPLPVDTSLPIHSLFRMKTRKEMSWRLNELEVQVKETWPHQLVWAIF